MTARLRGRMFGYSAPSVGGGSGMAVGGAVTGASSGGVLYTDGSNQLAQEPTLFFWDETNNRLGVGNAAPATALHVTGTVRASAGLTLDFLTATRVPFAGVAGAITDSALLTFTVGSGTLSATVLQATGLTAGRVPVAGVAGAITDDAGLLYDTSTDTLTSGALVLSSATAPVLKSTVTDGSAATQLEASRLQHLASVTATVGIAVYQSFWASNGVSGGGTLAEAARVKGILRGVANGTETGAIEFTLAGGAGSQASAGHISGTTVYGAAAIGVGTISATGVTTQLAVLTGNSSSMVALTNSNASAGGIQLTGTVNTSGARSFFVDTPSANTAITTATERITRAWGSTQTNGVPSLTSIVQTWANGTVALQRENVWNAPTYLQTSGTQVMTVACHHDFGSIPKITGTTNSLTGARVARFGGDAAQGVTAAATTYVGVELVPTTVTYTGATQVTSPVAASQLRLDILTLTDASAVTVDQAATLDIVGAVAQAGSVTITKKLALLVRAGGSQFNTVGFNDTTPIAKPTVTGAKGSNAALASLLTALANYGLITDSSTA